nr:putative membrane protein NMA1128 [uncultured bacterium]
MTADLSPVLILIISGIVGLLMIPFGLPGTWVILLGILGYGWLTQFATIGVWLIVLVTVLALLGEVFESWVGFRYAKRYGGSSRAGWGALVGGLIGAIVGVPIPIIGSVIAGFIGAFVGAALFEYTKARHAGGSVKAGWGAVLGRAAAVALKTAIGLVMIVAALFIALRKPA